MLPHRELAMFSTARFPALKLRGTTFWKDLKQNSCSFFFGPRDKSHVAL